MGILSIRRRDAEAERIGTLLLSILIIALCGLTYELLIGSLSSYLLGNSVYYFSITIGLFMSAMGIGSYLSKSIGRSLLEWFVAIEIAIGLVGGFTVLSLYASFSLANQVYYLAMFANIIAIGALVGLELPLLTRIARDYGPLRDVLAIVLSFDYVGALVASIVFPLVLVPYLGLMKTSFLVGMLNIGIVFVNLYIFRGHLERVRWLLLASAAVLVLLLGGFAYSWRITSFFEQRLYQDEILYTQQTKYQRIVVTRWHDDLRLYIDGAIQFSSRDEYRYHESLVHPALSTARSRERVLILGGGDGLAAREVLKYGDVQRITLVDLDPEMTRLASSYPPILALNEGSLSDPRVEVVNEDAYKFLENSSDLFSAIIIDLPDPRSESLSKLFSLEFYRLVARHLARGGVASVQSTSPYYAREAFWSTNHTMAAAGLFVRPYHTNIPSFGDWGFNMASTDPLDVVLPSISVSTRYVTGEAVSKMFIFEPDMAEVAADVNTLDNQAILRYYLKAWKEWRAR